MNFRVDGCDNIFIFDFFRFEKVKYEYVIVIICMEIHIFQVRIDNELIEMYEYFIFIEYEWW